MKHRVRDELTGILTVIGLMWVVFLVDLVLPGELTRWGLIPRTMRGLVGIATMPLLHGSLGHLTGNTVPLFVLMSLLAGSQAASGRVFAVIWVAGGGLLWLFGRSADHIGASGLVYGLVAFLLAAGVVERRLIAAGAAVLTGLLYGGSLIAGVLPTAGAAVSWDGHLCGAVAGILATSRLAGNRRRAIAG